MEKDYAERGAARPDPGSTPEEGSLVFRLQTASDSVWVGRRAADLAGELGFTQTACWGIGIAASELATNAVKHAGRGEIALRPLAEPEPGLEVVVSDRGPGIADPAAALEDGYSEGRRRTPDDPVFARNGLGVGLGAVGRLMDELEIRNRKKGGLAVTARKWFRAERRGPGR